MSLHDQAKVSGVTEACKYNDHDQCRNPACACTCHAPIPAPTIHPAMVPIVSLQTKVCPTCGDTRQAEEVYCRHDGSKLSSLICIHCGKVQEPGDKFCWHCGNSTNPSDPILVPLAGPPPAPPPSTVEEPAFAYDKEVLKGIQELTEGAKDEATKVVEEIDKPGGRGKFVITNRSNPNKIRAGGRLVSSAPIQTEGDVRTGDSGQSGGQGGEGSNPAPVRRVPIRLPIKPS